MSQRPVVFVAPLAKFVLEVLPWTLSGLIGLYLLWGFWSAPEHARAGAKPVAEQAVPATPSVGPRLAWLGPRAGRWM